MPDTPNRAHQNLPYPLHDYALLEIQERGERMEGGVIVPEVANEEPIEGIIIAVGMGRYADNGSGFIPIPSRIHVGARVVFAKFAGFDIEVDRKAYRLVRVDDILAAYSR
jgi:chaperonin GroES